MSVSSPTLPDMPTRKSKSFEIPIDVGKTYQETLLRRLHELGITQREVCNEAGIMETQFSRWVARPSEYTDKATDMRLNSVIRIEQAIAAIRARRKRSVADGV